MDTNPQTDARRRLSGTGQGRFNSPPAPPVVSSAASWNEKPLLLTIEEVSQLIGLSVRQIHRLKSLGGFPKEVRIGGSVRFRRQDIEEWVADGCPKLDN